MTYSKLIKKVKKKYKTLLKGINIEIVDSWGTTAYNPQQKSIVIFAEQIKEFTKSKRFIKRLGKYSPSQGLFITLLHEIGHVKQEQEYGIDELYAEQRKIYDSEDHDNNYLEIEADLFAKQEAKKWDLTKLKL